jgi:hypothetical protein
MNNGKSKEDFDRRSDEIAKGSVKSKDLIGGRQEMASP